MREMSADEWRRLFALLDVALELPPPARAPWLAALGGEAPQVRSALGDLLTLSEREDSGDFLTRLPQFTVTPGDAAAAPQGSAAGDLVGPYRLIARLGRGGMSSVWVAERTDGFPRRHVALKLPHTGLVLADLAERMARERDILASLEHPNIARLYDAGVAGDGRPYLALELVVGKPIDEYCAGHDTDLRTRVAIAVQTARAVAYAHSRMIVHRDLKPTNILVDASGQVRLLDFGISKLLEENPAADPKATQFGARAFTPDYASPEQIRGETVTASTDVYSFGIVLFQLLSGSLPFPAHPAAEAARNGAARDAARPSTMTLDRARALALRGDLDTIVGKCLKDSLWERYPGMQAVAEDLDRYLRGAPVLAQRDTTWYRLRKFTGRHRPTLLVTATVVAAAVATSSGLAIHRARQHHAETAQALEKFADTMARGAVPSTPPTDDVIAYHEYLKARGTMIRPTEENLHEVIRLTQDVTARDPKFAQAYAVLAGANVMFLDNGYTRPEAMMLAQRAVRQALALNPRLPGAHATVGALSAHRGDWPDAETHFAKAFALDDGTGRIRARYAEAVLVSTGRVQEALKIFRSQLRLTPTHPRAAMQVAATLSMQPDRDAEALSFVEIAMSHGWPPDSRDVEYLYGRISRRAGRLVEAAEHQLLTLPPALRETGARETLRLLTAALSAPAQRPHALESLDALRASAEAARMDPFAWLLFSMEWHTRLGDLERAYRSAEHWLHESRRVGRVGIPHLAQLWQPEMRAFRADPRFGDFARRLRLSAYWTEFGAPSECRARGAGFHCGLSPAE